MGRHRVSRMAAGLVMALALAGCAAGGPEFEAGQKLAGQQRWDDAILAFETAIQKNPDNREYRAGLARARAGAAEEQLRSAKAAAGRMSQLAEVDRGIVSVERALRYDPNHGPSLHFQAALRERRADLLRQVDQRLGQARSAAQAEAWAPAEAAIAQVLAIEPGNAAALGLRQEINLKAIEKSLRLAAQAEKAEDWREAARHWEEALGRDPSNETLRARLRVARQQDSLAHYLGRAGEWEAAGQLEKAFGFLRTAARYWPEDPALQEATSRVAREGRRRLYAEALRRAENDDWGRAYAALSQAVQAFGPAASVDVQLRSQVRQLAASIYERALEFDNQKQWGNTLFWFQVLQQLDPMYRDSANRLEQMREKLKDRASVKITVLDPESPKEAPDAGPIISGTIVTNLFKLGRRDFKVIEREALQSILKEMAIGQIGILDVETAKQIGKIAGIDVLLVGRVLQYKVDQNEAEGRKTVTVQMGTRTVQNPAYQLHLAAVQQGLKKASDPAPPQTIQETVQQLVTYKVGTVAATGYVSVSFRLIGVERGDILLAEKIDGEETFKQDYSEGVEAAGIPSVPKAAPIRTDMLNRVTQDVVGRLVQRVARHFGNRQEFFLNAGRELQRRRQFTRAVEEYMNCIASAELEGSGQEVAALARQYIEELARQ